MNAKRIESFENLKHGNKIISPIDNEVTGVYVDKNGEMFLGSLRCVYTIYQFRPSDFYIYDGDKGIEEIDAEYFL